MNTILSSIAASFIILPFLGYLLVFSASKLVTGNHRRSVNRAIDFTTFLLIISVHFLLGVIFGRSYLWLILLVLLALGMAFTVIQWKAKGEILFGKVLKGFWRFNFLLFLFCYVALILLGIVQRAAISVYSP